MNDGLANGRTDTQNFEQYNYNIIPSSLFCGRAYKYTDHIGLLVQG